MPDSKQKVIVGMFALTALILLSVLVLMFGGGRSFLTPTYDVNVKFADQVVGVQAGQSVTLNGKRIGETSEVEFWDKDNLESGLRVVVAVEDQYSIPKNSIMYVAANLMGIGKPNISIWVQDSASEKLTHDGKGMIEGKMLAPLDQVLKPEIQQQMLNTINQIGGLAESLRPVGANLTRMLEARDLKAVDKQLAQANFDTVVQRLDEVVKNLNSFIGDDQNRENFRAILANAKTMSEGGVKAMNRIDELGAQGADVVKNANEMLRRTGGTMDNISTLLQQLNTAMASVNSKEGTIGLMLNDKRLYEELVLTSKRLTKALDDVREVMDITKKGQLRIKAF